MDTQNTSRQLRYLEEVRIPLHRAGFGTLPVEGEQLPVLWNGHCFRRSAFRNVSSKDLQGDGQSHDRGSSHYRIE